MIDFLDKKIITAAFQVYFSNNYDDQEKWEEVLDALQEVREELKGKTLNTNQYTFKVDDLITRARLMRGELIKVGNMLIPCIESLEKWRDYFKHD